MKANLPFIKLFPNDIALQTQGLNNEQFGVYMKLFFYTWLYDLPNDDAVIQSIVGPGDYQTVLKRFFKVNDGNLVCPALESMRNKAIKEVEGNKARTAKATEARWKRDEYVTESVTVP